jgi:hypothetical protein
MKRILLALATALLSTQALAQTQFPPSTLWGNFTASAGLPTAVPVPNCPAGALNYTAGTGFGCGGGGGGGSSTLAHSHLFVGNGSNVATDFGALATFADTGGLTLAPSSGNALTINTAVGSIDRSLNINQTGPNLTTTVPAGTNCTLGNSVLAYNYLCINFDGANPTGGGVPYTTALNVGFVTGNSTSGGKKIGAVFTLLHVGTSNPGTPRDTIALSALAVSQAIEGGTNTGAGAKGTLFASEFNSTLAAGATNYLEVAGSEVDIGITTGASARYRFGWSVVDAGTIQGAELDAAYEVGATGNGWANAILITNAHGHPPIASTGCIICSDGTANAVATVIGFPNWTISGKIFDFTTAGYTVSGAGAVTATGLTLSTITGATRCLHVNTSGVVSGTATDCGTSGGGITAVTSTGSTLTVTGTTSVNIDLNLAHANTWTVAQTFSSINLTSAATGYQIGGATIIATATVGAAHYTTISDPAGAQFFAAGDNGDPSAYFTEDAIVFRNKAGTIWRSQTNATGISYGTTGSTSATLAIGFAIPTIFSGFCTGPSIVNANGTAAFTINVGTGCATGTGTINMSASASVGWTCSFYDVTTPNTNVVNQTGGAVNTVTLQNYTRAGAVANFTSSDIIRAQCIGY